MDTKAVDPIPIELACRQPTPLQQYFTRKSSNSLKSASSEDTAHESDLLKAIRGALRGSKEDASSSATSLLYRHADTSDEEDELAWDAHSVVLGSGGVIRKKWSFEEEGQPVQWACIGWFEQPATMLSHSLQSSGYTSEDQDYQEPSSEETEGRPTFGPFSRMSKESKPAEEPATLSKVVFVFLRSIGRVSLMNGLEHTFYLPFIVRRAWPMAPHGVMMQRILEPNELEEARASGEELLPTLFTMVNPFAEASTVGVTPLIQNGKPVVLQDKGPEKPIESMSAHEHVLWVSSPGTDAMNQVVTTLDTNTKTISIWRYAYTHPKDVPQAIPRRESRKGTKPRHSVSSPLSPRQTSFTSPIIEQPPLASLPGAPPELTMPTMATIVPGSIPDAPPTPTPIPGLKQHEHAVNLDKATVGGRVDSAPYIDPVDHVRMKPSFWMQKLFSEVISDAE
jgi:anaphase-promoting complex subunit 1